MPLPQRPERPGRNPQMQAWGDAYLDHAGAYNKRVVEPLLQQMAAEVAQFGSQDAQNAMVQLGLWVHRMPVLAAEEISRASDVDQVQRVADESRTKSLLFAVKHRAPNVSQQLIDRVADALSNEALRDNVAIPSAQEAGAAP